MSQSTHIWLLYRSSSAAHAGSPLQRLWAWLMRRPLLPPPPSDALREGAETQAQLLARRLPDLSACRALRSASELGHASGAVGARDRVLLIPMSPQVGPGADRLVAEARAALAGKGVPERVEMINTTLPEAVEAQAEAVRAALADLPPGTAYEVIFTAGELSPGDPSFVRLRGFAAVVAEAARLAVPHHLSTEQLWGIWGLCRGYHTLGGRLRDLGRRGVCAVVVVPLNTAVEEPALCQTMDGGLPDASRAAGVGTVVRASTPGGRPTFIRGIVARVVGEGAQNPDSQTV